MTTSLPHSIPDSQLGLSASEIHLLRQHQQIALSPSVHQQQQAYAHSTASTRGRGHARTSASTSRATSAASSQPGNRLVLDPGSLALLGQHFERLMGAIQNRVENVCAMQLLLLLLSLRPRSLGPLHCFVFFSISVNALMISIVRKVATLADQGPPFVGMI